VVGLLIWSPVEPEEFENRAEVDAVIPSGYKRPKVLDEQMSLGISVF
jgi:hypothetical protein